MPFNEPFDQDVIDERNNAPAAVKRKQKRSNEDLRKALNKYDDRQMLREMGLTPEDMDDE